MSSRGAQTGTGGFGGEDAEESANGTPGQEGIAVFRRDEEWLGITPMPRFIIT